MIRKRTNTRLVALTLALVGVLWAGAAQATDQAFSVQLQVRRSITVTVDRILDFGLVTQGAGLQTVLAADTGHTAGLNATSAKFSIDGEPNTTGLVVSLPSTALTLSSGANTIAVTLTGPSSGTVNLDGTGLGGPIYVGGTVTVNAGQATGTYTGTGTIRVIYP
ncbi:MAG: DUF4402 domain-containing protein [Candidatus Lambdaproteobacteria bacterium]|nr:DUF4402 domain-containing protein [Candidatus Lambdaproteobacteria bacterium]